MAKMKSRVRRSVEADTTSKKRSARVKTASSKKRAKVRTAASQSGVQSTLRSAETSAASPGVSSAALAPSELRSIRGAVSTPVGQAIDAEQRAMMNSPEGANIFDPNIGYGVALPGEKGVDAVARIKAERSKTKKSKVSKRKK